MGIVNLILCESKVRNFPCSRITKKGKAVFHIFWQTGVTNLWYLHKAYWLFIVLYHFLLFITQSTLSITCLYLQWNTKW